MTYPIVTELAARQWYRAWKQSCLEQDPPARVAAPDPDVSEIETGRDRDWNAIAEDAIDKLGALLENRGNAAFDGEGAVLLHRLLPDDAALRDPEFWIWFATVPGRDLVLARYPVSGARVATSDGKPKKIANPLPDSKNFWGSNARETLFFRLWIRAEMGRQPGADEEWEFVVPGMVDFWRSHVFRQLYAHHRPFLEAFVDFQFPADRTGARNEARLNTTDIRILARELSMTCANIVVEALDRGQCSALIWRVHEEKVARRSE